MVPELKAVKCLTIRQLFLSNTPRDQLASLHYFGQRIRQKYHMDQRGSTYSKRRTAIFEPGRGQLHAEPHVRQISCITIVARTGRGIEQTSSDEGL